MESLDIVQSGIVAYRLQFGRCDLSKTDSTRLVPLDPVDANGSSGGNEYQLGLLPAFELPWSDERIHPCWWQQRSPPFQIGHNTDDRINCHYLLALPTTSVFEMARRVDGGGGILVLAHNHHHHHHHHGSWDIEEVFRTRVLDDERGEVVDSVAAGGAPVGDEA